MNLRQAYDGWSQQEQNRQLYLKTREAFRKAWFTLPTNKPCSWYTADVLALALAETRVVESDKVKAASVMIHVLTWANFAEPKHNPAPDFKTEDVTRLMRLPADDLEKERERITVAMRNELIEETEQTALAAAAIDAQPVNHGDCPTDSSAAEIEGTVPCDSHRPDKGEKAHETEDTNDKPNEQTNMSNEKKPRGKQPKPVAQLDPTTLQVVKVWPSRCEAERETGACNIDRCIAHHRMSAGYYWCQPDEVDGFKPNPLSGNQPKQHKKKVDAATVNNALSENMKNLDAMKKSQPKDKDVIKTITKVRKFFHSVFGEENVLDVEYHDENNDPYMVACINFSANIQRLNIISDAYDDPTLWVSDIPTVGDNPDTGVSVFFHVNNDPGDDYKAWFESTLQEHAGDSPSVNAPLSQQGQSPCAPSAAEKALAVFTDDELLEELDRRGWEGELSRRQVVTIGAK